MDNLKIKLPLITVEQKNLLLKALNYYRISCVEFSYASDDIIFNTTNLMEIIEIQSKMVKEANEIE